MSKQLNLWLPSQACTAPLAEDLAVPNVRLMELERRQQLRHQVEPDSVNLVGLPTEGRVVLVSKGIWQYRLTLAEAATTEQVLSALWPTHREYQVGQKAPEFLRKTFLPGLNIYCCTGTKDSYLIEARMAPTATEAEADAEIRQKLAAAGLTPLELTLCRQVQPPYRSHLAAEALEALKADPLMRETLGEHVFTQYVAGKEKEWDEYRTHVSAWELEKYLITY